MNKMIFLGTSCMMPIKERNSSAILINIENHHILLDCGEGTQRQLRKINFSPAKINKILITHLHGDHVLGIPGLLQTIASSSPGKEIEIYGPKNTTNFIRTLGKLFQLSNLKLKINEVKKDSRIIDEKSFYITTKSLDHTIDCLGYSIIEKDKRRINLKYLKKFKLTKHPLLGKLQKGKSITYKGNKITPEKATIVIKGKKTTIITDTKFSNKLITFAKGSDVLVLEATYLHNLLDKANKYKHLTTKQAATIAKKSNSKKLILTHFSQRYKDLKQIKKEANSIFKNTIIAQDFKEIKI